MARESLTVEQILASLREAPARIATMSEGLTPVQLRAIPAEGEWSLVGVLAHLRACADMWGKAMMRIITEDRPTFPAINPRTWIKKTDYLEQEFEPSFRAFCAQRAELLVALEGLSPEGWARTAPVRVRGTTSEQTVLFYAELLARHERLHVTQIAQMVEAMRTE